MRKYTAAMACCAMLAVSASPLCAQSYPTRPIRMLVPSTPGGSVDTLARLVGGKLAERWSQQVVVDNRPGAGGTIAADVTAKAPPDGYTLIMGTVAAIATNVSLYSKLPYHPLKDLAPVTLVAQQQLVLLVHPGVAARSVKELIVLAKARPGELSFASAGNGSGGHLSGELFKILARIDLQHVPYKGVSPAIIDVISGQVTMTFASIISGMPPLKSGRLRGLAVTGAKRSPALADLPTMQEAGVPAYQSSTWYGVLAPARTPRDIIVKLQGEIARSVHSPEIAERLVAEGAEPAGSTPEEFRAFIAAEIEKWGKVIRAAGIKPG